MSISARLERSRPEAKARMVAAALEAMNRPEVKLTMSIARREVESRVGMKERKRATQIEVMSRPEVKIKHKAAVLAAMARPGMFEKLSQAMTRVLSQPEIKAKMSAAALNRDRESLNVAIKLAMNRPEVGAHHSKVMRGYRWITDGDISKHLKAGTKLPNGWRYGRA